MSSPGTGGRRGGTDGASTRVLSSLSEGVVVKGVIMPWRRHGECCHGRIRGAEERGPRTEANGGGGSSSSLAPAVPETSACRGDAASQRSGHPSTAAAAEWFV